MVYQVIFVCTISGIVGFKKPILGALAGIVTTLINYFIFYEFDQFLFYVLFLVGGFGGFACSWIIHWVFYGYTDDRNSSKPHYKAFPGGSGGSWGGGVVYTDDEHKNAQENSKDMG